MKAEAILRLEKSETAVVHAASRIYAAYVASGALADHSEDEILQKSVRIAIRMALFTDNLVQSDDEQMLGVLGLGLGE